MDVQKEINLRNAISYCIENNDANTATNRIMEFIRDEKEAINFIQCCTELPNKAVKDSQLSDMVAGYKMMCKPEANFEKYYSKGFTECWEWLKRITK